MAHGPPESAVQNRFSPLRIESLQCDSLTGGILSHIYPYYLPYYIYNYLPQIYKYYYEVPTSWT